MEDLIPIVIFIILSIIFGGKKSKKKEKTTTTHFDSNGKIIDPSKSKPNKKSSFSSSVNSLKDVLKSFKDFEQKNFEKRKDFSSNKSNKFTEQKKEPVVNYDEKYSNYEQPRDKKTVVTNRSDYLETKNRSHSIHDNMAKKSSFSYDAIPNKKSSLLNFKTDLSKRNELKKAIVLKEIIGKCKAFQN